MREAYQRRFSISTQLKKEIGNAINKFKVRYWKRQKYYLKPQVICRRLEIPAVTSDEIIELLKLNGKVEVKLSDFLNLYFKSYDATIESYWVGSDPARVYPEIVSFAIERDFIIIWNVDSIIKNRNYNPKQGEYKG